MTLAVLSRAVLTPLGDLAATVSAISGGEHAGSIDPATRLAVARLSATPSAKRHARLVGALPALALDVARSVAHALPAGPRTGVFVATGGLRAHWDELAPAMAEQAADGTHAWARGLSRLHPLWMLRYLSNGAHAVIAAELGMLGDGATFAGPAAAASAVIAAEAALVAGSLDQALVVALDDVAADEVAVELAARAPRIVPGAGIAAVALGRSGGLRLDAADGVDVSAEPTPAAIAAVRGRLPDADRDVSFAIYTGWLGAATPLVDAIVACELLQIGWPSHLDLGNPRSVTVTASASPGQIGVLRVEAP